jgi:hypothetical protein
MTLMLSVQYMEFFSHPVKAFSLTKKKKLGEISFVVVPPLLIRNFFSTLTFKVISALNDYFNEVKTYFFPASWVFVFYFACLSNQV